MKRPVRSKSLRYVETEECDVPSSVPEERLLRGMVELAVSDFIDPKRTNSFEDKKVIRHSAKTWLFSPPNEPLRPFSFPWVCQQLDGDGEALRTRILDTLMVRTGELKKDVV